jgi:hypothetical protein
MEESPDCPEGYDCKTEIMKNTSISIMDDSIGKQYLKFEDNNQYNTIKYTYSYKGRPEIADDGYSEEIYFQVPVDKTELKAENKGLTKLRLTHAKHCFCPDAGYEVITEGKIEMLKADDSYYVRLDIQTDKDTRIKTLKTKVSL